MLFTASAVGSQTTLARIIRMVRQAQSSKPEIGQLADKISAVFVPAVVVIALISAAIWYFFGPAPQIVYTLVIATTVLIIACPCALGLGDADVDYLRRWPGGGVRRAGARCRCAAARQ